MYNQARPTIHIPACLFERLGGWTAIDTVIVQGCRRIWADPELAQVRARADRAWLEGVLADFFSEALGGPERLPRAFLDAQRIALTGEQFTCVAVHLHGAVLDLGLDDSLMEDVEKAVVGRVCGGHLSTRQPALEKPHEGDSLMS
jgi:hemoglobin